MLSLTVRKEEMKMYKYELHMHTKEGSACGKTSGADMVDFYIENGYAGMVVTDHFYHGNTTQYVEKIAQSVPAKSGGKHSSE